MAIRMTITHRSHPRGFPRQYTEETFDVDLISMDEMEFPDIDLRAMMSAQAIGIDIYDVMMDFYSNYTDQPNGFFWFLSEHAGDFYEALEEQGYENFDRGRLTRKKLADLLRRNSEASASFVENYSLKAIANSVDFSEDDQGLFSQDEARDILLNALKEERTTGRLIMKLLKPFIKNLDEEDDADILKEYAKGLVVAYFNSPTISKDKVRDELKKYVDEEDIDYTAEPLGEGEGEGWVSEEYGHELKVFGETFHIWKSMVETRIIDPISFETELNDGKDYDSEWGTPDGVDDFLRIFDKEVIEPEPLMIEAPVSDEDGEYAVIYNTDSSDYGRSPLEITVPYETKFEATEAIELSKEVMSRDGFNDWTMAIYKLVDDEWMQLEPEWQYDRKKWRWKQVEED